MYKKKKKKEFLNSKQNQNVIAYLAQWTRGMFSENSIIILLAIMLLIDQEDLHDGLQSSLEIPRSTFILCSCS